MKVLCPFCGKLAEAENVQAGPDGLTWVCGACGKTVTEQAEKAGAGDGREGDVEGVSSGANQGGDASVKETDDSRCPKCGAPRTDRPDCPRCGLVFERWNPQTGLELLPALEAAWETLLDDYDAPAAHERFVEEARGLGRLDLAAAYYRSRAAENPDDSMAERQLDRIAAMVQFEALVPRQRPQLVSPTFIWVMRVVLGVLVLVGLYYVFTFSVPAPAPVQGASPRTVQPGGGPTVEPAPPGQRPGSAPVDQERARNPRPGQPSSVESSDAGGASLGHSARQPGRAGPRSSFSDSSQKAGQASHSPRK